MAAAYELRRGQGLAGLVEGESFDFKHVRDYEVATSRVLNNEFVFCFEEGDDAPAVGAGVEDEEVDRPKAKRPRGAYFTPLDQAQTLRKRRPRVSGERFRIQYMQRVLVWSHFADAHLAARRGSNRISARTHRTGDCLLGWNRSPGEFN